MLKLPTLFQDIDAYPMLSNAKKKSFLSFCEVYAEYIDILNELPSEVEMLVFSHEDWNEKNIFLRIELQMFENHFMSFFKAKRLITAINNSFENSDSYTSTALLRQFFEETIYFHHFVTNIEGKITTICEYAKGRYNSKDKNFLTTKLYEIHKLIEKSYYSSSYNFRNKHSPKVKIKSTNILTIIQKYDKESPYPLKDFYDRLSEYVHPNYGSRMLLKKNTEVLANNPDLDLLTLGMNNSSSEIGYFLDQFLEPLNAISIIAIDTINRAYEQMSFMKNLTSYADGKKELIEVPNRIIN
ncbi:hypothetical protein N9I89_04250 [Porticoccaceae bacterium]|nr:hypothetical protein [Porticoccaceae bacterium]